MKLPAKSLLKGHGGYRVPFNQNLGFYITMAIIPLDFNENFFPPLISILLLFAGKVHGLIIHATTCIHCRALEA